jgi:cysteine desulfuration protein SufE
MKLDEYLAEFEGLDPEERLEMLIDFSEHLPPLGPAQAVLCDAGECRVQECQTPVFLWVGVVDQRVQLAASVPEKSPTVRGFVAMLVTGLSGATPADVAALPDDIPARLGLQETLGMTRHRGFRGIIVRIKRDVALQTASASTAAGSDSLSGTA